MTLRRSGSGSPQRAHNSGPRRLGRLNVTCSHEGHDTYGTVLVTSDSWSFVWVDRSPAPDRQGVDASALTSYLPWRRNTTLIRTPGVTDADGQRRTAAASTRHFACRAGGLAGA